MAEPILTIICPVYNHEKYLEQTLESFLSQKTNFDFHILIHDDASTDNSIKIIEKYVALFPSIITPIFQKVNQHSLGIPNSTIIYPLVKTKYVAICEGDDYWTDPYKLQKQVDFLEENQDYIISTHNINIIGWEANLNIYDISQEDCDLSFASWLKRSQAHTSSYVINLTEVNIILLSKFLKKIKYPDTALVLILLLVSGKKCKWFNQKMSVYRVHQMGISYDIKNDSFDSKIEFLNQTIYLFTKLLKISDNNFKKKIEIEIKNLCNYIIRLNWHDKGIKAAMVAWFKLFLFKPKFISRKIPLEIFRIKKNNLKK